MSFSNVRFCTLFSGSDGNSVYIKLGGAEILIDVGKPATSVERGLNLIGSSLKNISAIFITHEHTDHIQGACVIAKKHKIPIFITEGSANNIKTLPCTAVVMPSLFEVSIDNVRVKSFLTPHDSAMSVGYIVENDVYRFGVATDMGMISKSVVEAMAGCDAALIESNYDEVMLRNGPYPLYLKERIASKAGHLSNKNGALLAAILAASGTKHITLGHLSAENNTPQLALDTARNELITRGLQAEIKVANRHEPSLIFEERKYASNQHHLPRNA